MRSQLSIPASLLANVNQKFCREKDLKGNPHEKLRQIKWKTVNGNAINSRKINAFQRAISKRSTNLSTTESRIPRTSRSECQKTVTTTHRTLIKETLQEARYG